MKKLIETIRNIWNIVDLRERLLVTLGILAIYRFGSFVVIPGVDPAQLSALQDQTADGLLGLLNMFTGGAFSQASIFALGIMPYIQHLLLFNYWVWPFLIFKNYKKRVKVVEEKLIILQGT